ncbi:SpoIIE family protein phosphatase [Candidatus Sumerlaeota bacterium]|nr:SpoIIE family protein phosphatase [Candidatus Sumerlaeota bacterium]
MKACDRPILPLSRSPTRDFPVSPIPPLPHSSPLSPIEHGVATRALPGEIVCGDLHVVQPFQTREDDGQPTGVLIAAIDALGHGEEAAAAAETAAATLRKFAHESPIALIRRCHQRLARGRGAAMSIVSISSRERMMTWIGVGNVEGMLLRASQEVNPARESLMLRGGAVGYQLPTLRAAVLAVESGDLLMLATDGIRGGFAESVVPTSSPQGIADSILSRHGRDSDDALVLVVRFLGGAP